MVDCVCVIVVVGIAEVDGRFSTCVCVDRVAFEGLEVDTAVVVRGVDTVRELPLEVTDDTEREGPSLEATRAGLSRKRLNSYFAAAG